MQMLVADTRCIMVFSTTHYFSTILDFRPSLDLVVLKLIIGGARMG
jgi:hypothetical protein